MTFKINDNSFIDANASLTTTELNVSDGSSINIVQLYPNAMGTVAGFVGSSTTNMNRYPFAVEENATSVGGITVSHYGGTVGNSSQTHGFVAGGLTSWFVLTNQIDKYPFSTSVTSVDMGDLTVARHDVASQSSYTHGYSSGGLTNTGGGPVNTIDKFPFASNINATNIGDLTQVRAGTGTSSSSHGYTSGKVVTFSPAVYGPNTIDRFPFATDSNASDVGDLNTGGYGTNNASGQSSETHGYHTGSEEPSYWGTGILKFAFASSTSTSTVGNVANQGGGAGSSSVSHGYDAGGRPWYSSNTNAIEKFPFATDGNAVTNRYLTADRGTDTGTQD